MRGKIDRQEQIKQKVSVWRHVFKFAIIFYYFCCIMIRQAILVGGLVLYGFLITQLVGDIRTPTIRIRRLKLHQILPEDHRQ